MHTGNPRLVVAMMGLPSKMSHYLLMLALACVPVMFLLPIINHGLTRIFTDYFGRNTRLRHSRAGKAQKAHNRRLHRLLRQGLIILLAYLMLLDPVCLQQLAQASSQYSNVTTGDWGSGNRTIEYAYDANGSCVSKITKETSTGETVETATYDYNLRNKLSRMVREYTEGSDDIVEVVAYTYNDDGDRIKSSRYVTINGGEPTGGVDKLFLIDPYNHTGYSQVLLEWDGYTSTTYTIADDVVTQSANNYDGRTTSHLLYDGQGSTRQLTDDSGAILDAQVFNYDGYGVEVGYVGGEIYEQPLTNLRYAGEYLDTNMRQYNLRARYYDPLNGRFNQIDPYMGNNYDPQSLHKYLYCHANPVNATDPSGLMFEGVTGLLNNISLYITVFWMVYGGPILNTLFNVMLFTGVIWAAANISQVLIDWGYLPRSIQSYTEAVGYYAGVGFVMSFAALTILTATMGDPRNARPAQYVPRLEQDKAVNGRPARPPLSTDRPVAQNAYINAEKDRDVLRIKQQGAFQVRVDQRQVQALNENNIVQKGLNRPDTQGLFGNKPNVTIEYDTNLNNLLIRRDRILANDPSVEVILKWFDLTGKYTIVP